MKKMFKVLTHVETKSGGYWMRIGSAFLNKDDSINVLCEAFPKSFQLQLRELDEEDLRRRETYSTTSSAVLAKPVTAPSASGDLPF